MFCQNVFIHTPTPSSFIVFTFGLAFESFKEFGGASKALKGKSQLKVIGGYESK
jgi:hypothetical protein